MAMALAEPTDASQLLVPAIGVPDAGMNGATVGRPRIPSAAAFSNPAAATSLKSGAASLSLGLLPWDVRTLRPQPPPGCAIVRTLKPPFSRVDTRLAARFIGLVFARISDRRLRKSSKERESMRQELVR